MTTCKMKIFHRQTDDRKQTIRKSQVKRGPGPH